MSSAQLRTTFLEFFRSRGHEVVPSSSLLPTNDPTLLFTNAGMVPFKNLFLGIEQRHYVRATSSQRCVRAGGKHNDLENVGYTARHHTFFEMLGNFSFGDYFKQEAIEYAWEFLTQTLAIPAEKLWITVYEEDDESADLWLKRIGIDPSRLSRIGAEDNFWSMGDTGPCGPCSEIFYDHGPSVAGGPPGTPEGDGDRYVEIWNLVFMQYDRSADGTMSALPKPSVDTGMGLERLAAVLQGVSSNYDIDLLANLVGAVMKITGCSDRNNASLKVVADHIRSCAFLITDGVIPSNEGRGYVLRRIIRRAIRHGHKLGTKEPFFFKLAQPLAAEMGDAYPELNQALDQVQRVLKTEEARFAETLEQGLKQLENDIATLGDDSSRTIPGETVFRLYDTYGFPADLTADIAREKGLSVDMPGFETHMQAQRQRARATKQFDNDYAERMQIKGSTRFTGYQQLTDSATITALYHDGAETDHLEAGQKGLIVTDSTPFYAESGGQVGDRGTITSDTATFVVQDTQKQGADAHTHLGEMRSGTLAVGDHITAHVDTATRHAIELNHSATHLMHAALREILGEHVSQKGSLVDEKRLRFDFSHFEAVTAEQLSAIEKRVNQQIRHNDAVETTLMSADDAVATGA
ncbi:MAG: alanine--tRNA ligase, partial [Gammaproteobacteria bacterium]|nr:alanine--tRNA ligase [Gammaproteobacteria bacterium]